MLIHPDGTGAKMILDLRSKPGGWLLYDGTVWSPDEKQLLLNEEQFDGPHGYVMMIDLASEKSTARSRNGYPILGWSPIPAD